MIRVSPKSLEVRTSEVLFHKEGKLMDNIHPHTDQYAC